MLFETLGQRILQENISLEMVPMVRLDKVPHGKPQWHLSHIFPIQFWSRLEALNDRSHLDVKPTRVVQSVVPSPVKEGVYYVPEKTNQVAIDSFVVSGGHLYVFQFTPS